MKIFPLKTSAGYSPIGVFDSGYGGLTVLKEIVAQLPQYDYLYLGDNARAPYGPRTYETVYEYTWQCVQQLFARGCELVILACNTASAKALRSIQQKDLPVHAPDKRVLGVIRPTAEVIGNYSTSGHVGLFATAGTVNSESYVLEIRKFFPELTLYQEACPIWVPLIENNEIDNEGTAYFVRRHVQQLFSKAPDIDAIILACTHYPLLAKQIEKALPRPVTLLSQGGIVAQSLVDYLQRHPGMETRCSKEGTLKFLSTDYPSNFDKHASLFFGREVKSEHLAL